MMFSHLFPSTIVTKFLPLKTISYALQFRASWHVYCVVSAFSSLPVADCSRWLFPRLKALRPTIIDREKLSIKSTDRSQQRVGGGCNAYCTGPETSATKTSGSPDK